MRPLLTITHGITLNRRILITGSSGLVGSALSVSLKEAGAGLSLLDVSATGTSRGDVREAARVREALEGCDGVIHLAAISRVIWGEQRPEECWDVNVNGVSNVLEAAARAGNNPWVIFASSREVYGQPSALPASEDTPLAPVNVYGRAKVRGEELVEAARRDGVRATTVRLSNVYGSPLDHADRVVPAFTKAALDGRVLRVDGEEHTFDFTFVDDVARGLLSLAELLDETSTPPPPIHLVTGAPTTLGQLARVAIGIAGTASEIRQAPPRSFDVARFYGDPERARRLLGWEATVGIEAGVRLLASRFEALDRGETI